MARPQYHVAPTAVCIMLAYCIGGGLQEAAAACISGFFIDIDHLSIRRIKNILNGRRKDYVPGWVDYFHTWYAALIILIINVNIGWWFVLLSYVIHILIDSANRENLVSHESPLPKFLFRFYPPWLTYRSGL